MAKLGGRYTVILISLAGAALSGGQVNAQLWQPMCAEGQVCEFDGTRVIRFGAGESFSFATATEVVDCSVATFGGDPAPNVPKVCEAYYTAKDVAFNASNRQQAARLHELEEQVGSLQAELDDANAELNQFRRAMRRDERRGRRLDRFEQFGPIYRERR